MEWEEIRRNCPDAEGYSVIDGSAVDITGFTKLHRIFANREEPVVIELPGGLVGDKDNPWFGSSPPPAPKKWGRALYYKLS